MNKYESVVIINPTVDEEGVKSLVAKFTDLINTDGKVEKVDDLGKRKLAYEVKKQKEGYYQVFNFEANPELTSIGTPAQYSQYLESIFPESKVKDIVYHGTHAKFDKFDKNFIKKDGVNSFGD